MKKFVSILVFVLLAVGGVAAAPQDTTAGETAQQKADRMRWWREGRFGMFIHWGPVSIMGTEISWSRGGERRGIGGTGDIPVDVYDNLYKQFNPTAFHADEWVAQARAAGMNYMVLTAKHCDGFCLWRSSVDEYNIGNSPFRRDVCGELARAAHSAGMRIGWYYSPMDWRDPDCRTSRNSVYVKKMQGHLRELLANYGRIDLLWFDADGGPIPWDQKTTYRLVRSLQPQIVIDDRLGIGPREERAKQPPDPYADYLTPEQRVGSFNFSRPWETCMTLGTQWSWKPNDRIKPWSECVRILVQCVTGDGNLLLNVGPTPEGDIEPRQAEVLRQIGSWLKKYGESIYGTRGGPIRNGTWGGSTRKGNFVYLHVLQWEDHEIRLPLLAARIKRYTTLTGGNATIEQTVDELIVRIPQAEEDSVDTIVRLELDRPAGKLELADLRENRPPDLDSAVVLLKNRPDTPFVAPASILLDGKRGTTDRLDGRWMGFAGRDFEAVLDFRSAKRFTKVTVGCLQEQVTSIFLPAAVEVAVSNDGKVFTSVGRTATGEQNVDAEIRSHDFPLTFPAVTARYLRVRAVNIGICPAWHEHAGKKAWILVDEIAVR